MIKICFRFLKKQASTPLIPSAQDEHHNPRWGIASRIYVWPKDLGFKDIAANSKFTSDPSHPLFPNAGF